MLVWLKKQTSIFWKVPSLLFSELCVALPAGDVQTQKFLPFFFCLNTGKTKVDSKGTNLQNCEIEVKPTSWQTTGHSFGTVRRQVINSYRLGQNPTYFIIFYLLEALPCTFNNT